MAMKRYKSPRSEAGDSPGSASAPIRRAWQGLAVACVGLGGLGAVLPLVPTTPFLLLAAWAASRSSPELHEWLYRHPRYGPLLRDWRDHRALRPRVKCVALLLITVSWLIMMVTVDSDPIRLLASAVMLTVAVFLGTRPAHPGDE